MTTHWHGIISVPLNIRVPGLLWKSGYGKAITAKERLLEIISEKLKYQPSEIASGIEDSNNGDLATRNILLFISALIPKALASLMTSLIVALAKPENIRYRECVHDDVLLEEVVLECQRMWPPFLGGRRICTESCTIGGYTIPEGHGVAYISHISNRDKLVFKDPDKFRPERWRDENSSDKDLIWTYGGGPRACIGRHLSTTILKEWLHQLLSTLQWDVTVNEDTQYNNYKVLPVFRPSDNIHVRFTSLPTTSHDNDDVITTDINTEL